MISQHSVMLTFQDVKYVIYNKNDVSDSLQDCVFWSSFLSLVYSKQWKECCFSNMWKVTDQFIKPIYVLSVLIMIWNSSKSKGYKYFILLTSEFFREYNSGCCDGYYFHLTKAACTSEHFLIWKHMKSTFFIFVFSIKTFIIINCFCE